MDAEIRAAGAVVWRRGPEGVQVCLVHRPKYDDWTIPKGKLDPGEDFADAARREVREETGFRGLLGEDLGEVRYVVDRPGQRGAKRVRYWSMHADDGSFAPHAEIDAIAWLALAAAEEALTYDRDREVLARFRATVAT